MSAAETYLMYVDESGDENSTFHSALLIPLPLWTTYLGQWLKFRRWLYTQHGVPARFELHAYTWLNVKESGAPDRPLPAPDNPTAAINTSKSLRREITVKALKAIRSMNSMGILTCESASTDPATAYRAVVESVDKHLVDRDGWAITALDGDPGNPPPHLHRAHRDLDIGTRRIVEDGLSVRQAEALAQTPAAERPSISRSASAAKDADLLLL
ncbi:MAG: hypothetical protein J0H43_01165, partial [Actinobacteria bacterium]|nr:hypothetical protein [Actinomycetota bacterium]